MRVKGSITRIPRHDTARITPVAPIPPIYVNFNPENAQNEREDFIITAFHMGLTGNETRLVDLEV